MGGRRGYHSYDQTETNFYQPEQINFDKLKSKLKNSNVTSCYSSEEGGRFYQEQTLNEIIEISSNQSLELPKNYRWVSLKEVCLLIQESNYFTNEIRSMFAMLLNQFKIL